MQEKIFDGYGLSLDSADAVQQSKDEMRRQAYHHIMTEVMDHIVWRFDIEKMKVVDVSQSVERLRGYKKERIIGLTLDKILMPMSYQKMLENLSVCLDELEGRKQEYKSFTMTVEQPCSEGSIWTEFIICLVQHADGEFEAVGVSRDFGQQKNLVEVCRQLSEHERRLQTMWDAAPCLLSCLDEDGCLIQVNKQFAELFTIQSEDICGLRLQELLGDAVWARHETLFQASITGKKAIFDDGLMCKQGNKWLCGAYQPIMGADGEVKQVLWAAIDISNQQKLVQQLDQAERAGKMGSWRLHVKSGQFSCSDYFLELLGSNRKAAEGREYQLVRQCLDAEGLEILRTWAHAEWLPQANRLETELQLQLPGDVRKTVRVTGCINLDTEGNVQDIVGAMVDISQQKVLETGLQEQIARLRNFCHTLPGTSLVVSREGMVIELFDERLGLSVVRSDQKSGQSLHSLVTGEPGKQLLEAIVKTIDKQCVQFGEYQLKTPNGQRIYDIRMSPMEDWDSKHKTAACYLLDITEQKKTKKVLQQTYEKRRQREILNDLATGILAPSKLVLDEAWQVKLNLSQEFSCYLISLESKKQYQDRENLQIQIDKLVQNLVVEFGFIAWESKDGIGILWPTAGSNNINESEEIQRAHKLGEAIQRPAACWDYYIGISEYHEGMFWQFAKVYEQARTALEFGKKLCSAHRINHYLEIGVLQFFPAVKEDGHVKDYVQRMLGKLMEYDKAQGTELTSTLEKILQTDNLKTVAEHFYVHRQTIIFRKRRIEMILGVSLDSFETRLALGMALKFRQVFAEPDS